MSWRRFLRRTQWDHDRAEELRSYLEIETDANMARGMSAADARRAAHRKLGNTVRIREEIYQMNTIGLLDSLERAVRYALRGMRRRPTFTLAVVLTLALGIGANTAIFAVVYGVVIKPLPYPDADRLVSLQHAAPGLNIEALGMTPTMYFTYRDEGRTFAHIGLWAPGGQSVTGLGEPEQARTLWVTYGTLQALGVQPLMGRSFTQADDTPGAQGNPVILSYGYWQRRFGGAASVLGRKMTIDARPSEVVGVMPADFRFLNMQPQPDVILIQRLDRNGLFLGGGGFQGVARLKPGVTVADANADVQRMLPIWLNAWPPPPGLARQAVENWRISPAVRALKDDVIGNVVIMLWVLMGTIGMVLLIACANVANLMLVRSDGRRQEFAVRTALGAGRGHIVKELLVESVVLGVCGGALGVGLASIGLKLLVEMGPTNLPRLDDISLDPRVFAFAVMATLVSSLLFGSISALKHTSPAGVPVSGNARGASLSRERQRTRNALVVVQVALALGLLVGSGLMIRTFQALRNTDPGFTAPAELQTARIWVPPFQIREVNRFTRMQHDILDEIAAIPGVVSASFASAIPLEGRINANPVYAEDRIYDPGTMPPARRFKFVAPGYFKTMGTRLIAGRDITWTDIEQGGEVAVISENLARELWRDPAAAIGKRIHEPGGDAPYVWREVVGVVQDVYEDGLYKPATTTVYWPVMMAKFFGAQGFGNRAIALVMRSDQAGNESLLGEVRRAVWSINPSLPVFLVRTMKDLYDESLGTTSFALVMLAIAGVMALSLGIIGIYGVMAYVVSHRAREIGIRLALGAEPAALKRMFVRHGLALSGIGAAAGLAVAVALSRLMSSLLFEISPLDPTTYVAVLGILLTAAALASYVPACRAAAVDPVVTLGME